LTVSIGFNVNSEVTYFLLDHPNTWCSKRSIPPKIFFAAKLADIFYTRT